MEPRRRWIIAIVLSVLVLVPALVVAVPSLKKAPQGGVYGAQSLQFAQLPGERVVRNDLGAPEPPAGVEPRLIARFVQVSDVHILDDDAKHTRAETLDVLGEPFTSAQRPQEEFTDELLNSLIARINALHAQGELDFAVATGDNVDNALENEIIRLLDNWDGTYTSTSPHGPMLPDGQSASHEDHANDVLLAPTGLPASFREPGNNTALGPDIPLYMVFGNHDALVQGNLPPFTAFKKTVETMDRHFVDKAEYIGLHFQSQPCPETSGATLLAAALRPEPDGGFPPLRANGDGFGFGHAPNLCADDIHDVGYYSFSVGPVHYVVLDTVNDDWAMNNGYYEQIASNSPFRFPNRGGDRFGGYASGSIGPTQMRWLRNEIENNPDKMIVLFAHHTINSFYLPDSTPQQFGYQTGRTFTQFLQQYPNVAAFIGGHTHQNRVQAKGDLTVQPAQGFWNVETSSVIDMPQEARVIEVWHYPGTNVGFVRISLFTHTLEDVRALSASDPQHEDGFASGAPEDRDVDLYFTLTPTVAAAFEAYARP